MAASIRSGTPDLGDSDLLVHMGSTDPLPTTAAGPIEQQESIALEALKFPLHSNAARVRVMKNALGELVLK